MLSKREMPRCVVALRVVSTGGECLGSLSTLRAARAVSLRRRLDEITERNIRG